MDETTRWFERMKMSIAILEDVDLAHVRPKVEARPEYFGHEGSRYLMWHVTVWAHIPAPGQGFGTREVKYDSSGACAFLEYAFRAIYEANLIKIAERHSPKARPVMSITSRSSARV